MKYKMVHTELESKLMMTVYFKTRRQARAAQRAVLKNKWFKCYSPEGIQIWKLIISSSDCRVGMMKATVKKVEYE